MVSHFFICAHFFMRIANVTFFLYSLTVCTSSIFGGEPDIKVQIFYGYSSPDFKGAVLKTHNSQLKAHLLEGVNFWSSRSPLPPRSKRTNKTKSIQL